MDGRIFLLITVLGGEKLCQCCPLHSIEGPKGIQGEIIATTSCGTTVHFTTLHPMEDGEQTYLFICYIPR